MSNVAGNRESRNVSDSDEEESEPPVTGESTLSTSRYTAKDRWVTWTESLGFDQSISDAVTYDDLRAEMAITPSQTVGESLGEGSRSRRITHEKSSSSEMQDFPPLLSTLNVNGRPRFVFVRRIENGRLQIQMVPNERPELLATVHESGRLTLSFIKSENRNRQDDDEVEECSINTVKDEESRVKEVEISSIGGDKEEELHGAGEGNDARSLTLSQGCGKKITLVKF